MRLSSPRPELLYVKEAELVGIRVVVEGLLGEAAAGDGEFVQAQLVALDVRVNQY